MQPYSTACAVSTCVLCGRVVREANGVITTRESLSGLHWFRLATKRVVEPGNPSCAHKWEKERLLFQVLRAPIVYPTALVASVILFVAGVVSFVMAIASRVRRLRGKAIEGNNLCAQEGQQQGRNRTGAPRTSDMARKSLRLAIALWIYTFVLQAGLMPRTRAPITLGSFLVVLLCGVILPFVIGLWGIVAGTVALKGIRRERGRLTGRGRAIAGVSLSALPLLLILTGMVIPFLQRDRDTLTAIEQTIRGKPTPLHMAAVEGRAEVAKALIDKGADVNAKDREGWTPLHSAAMDGNVDIVRLLINDGAYVDAKGGEDTWTPLHLAAFFGRYDAAKLLTEKGADVNAEDKLGRTPLELAAEEGHQELADLLRKHVCPET